MFNEESVFFFKFSSADIMIGVWINWAGLNNSGRP